MIRYPLLYGAVFGVLVAVVRWRRYAEDIEGSRRALRASVCILTGFLFAVAVGMFTSGLVFESGRQLLPLACWVLFVTWTGVFVGVGTVRRRFAAVD